jgi:flagellar motility protein MotE (MotC chaperone)
MIRLARDFRLIPIVVLATVSLFALKVSGLVFDGGYTFAERMQNHYEPKIAVSTNERPPDYPKIVVADSRPTPAPPAPGAKIPWAQEMFNFNASDAGHDITGSIGGGEKPTAAPPPAAAKPQVPPPSIDAGNTSIKIAPGQLSSPGELALLKSLQGRRQELDARGRELDMRESLLKAAEKRVEAKVAELKAMEARVKTAVGTRDKQEADRFKGIVTMYENMKAKEAARIFDRLDLGILIEVATAMNPRKMSEILAQMTPESAERLTVELASRANASATRSPDKLPKIQGAPNAQ